MTIQVRQKDSGDRRWVDPSRDLAHNFPTLMTKAAELIDGDRWPVFRKYLSDNKISIDDLGEVMVALARFTMTSLEKPEESMDDCFRRAGCYDVRQPAMLAYLACIGSVVLGGVFIGRREAFMGEGTVEHPYNLETAAKRFRLLMGIPPWRRRLYRVWKDIRRAIRRFRSS